MKFIHTADWHVGKTLRGRSRADEHTALLREISEIAKDEQVDALLIAGDLFDSSAPTPESERIVYNALIEMTKLVSHVVIVSGNHDNSMRLEAIKPLLSLTNIYALPYPTRPENGGVFSFETENKEKVNIALLPFLSQRSIIRAEQLMTGEVVDHVQEYAERAVRIIENLCTNLSEGSINLFVGHAMVHGGVLGGGERSAHTVFEYSIPTSAFPPKISYVALGHLHRVQRLPAACPVWYSGSPLPLDFSENEDSKSVNVVEVSPGKPAKVKQVNLKSYKRLRIIQGTLETLQAMADEVRGDYLKVEVTGPPSPGLADQVRELLPNAVDVRLIRPDAMNPKRDEKRSARSPQELFAQYLKERDEDDSDVKKLFNELLDEVNAPH